MVEAIVASGCKRVGLTNWVLVEYALWAGLQHAGWDGRIEHVDVKNESRVLEDVDFVPCAIVRQTGYPPFEPRVGFVETAYGSLSLALKGARRIALHRMARPHTNQDHDGVRRSFIYPGE